MAFFAHPTPAGFCQNLKEMKKVYRDLYESGYQWEDFVDHLLVEGLYGGQNKKTRCSVQSEAAAKPGNSSDGQSLPVGRKDGQNRFQVALDVHNYKPEELSIKVREDSVTIHGKHEEKLASDGFVSREFTRKWSLPRGVKVELMRSSLSSNGVLSLEAPIEPLQAPTETSIPISIESAVNQVDAVQEKADWEVIGPKEGATLENGAK